ncbi:hypothetical protein CVT25_003503 [Psilocybe cyanescens]|uniref:Uncharacterized protein n=1 Tax=Psilocybe cyanescens TaxID=93625 RepID=A0A409WP22_PSICY|nr:hypothetical protein CVT25_003503 [Psilocybe cyanescens]
MPVMAQDAQTTSEALNITEGTKQKAIRITGHGKMKQWIASSLTFLETTDEDRTLVFHTLPPTIDPQATLQQETGKQVSQKSASTSTDLISRLISVVEIIKREYVKNLDAKRSARMIGLHQYNEIGDLEALGASITPLVEEGMDEDTAEAKRSRTIIQALGGKNHPRQSQTPFMRVTLSLYEHPKLIENGATYQPPIKRKMSKSAKTRAKKRVKKAKAADIEMINESTSRDKVGSS